MILRGFLLSSCLGGGRLEMLDVLERRECDWFVKHVWWLVSLLE